MTNTDMSLRDAAQAVIDRWETPLWKDAPATAVFIADLRDALARDAGRAPLSANAGEPTCDMRTVVAVAVTMLYDTHPEDVCRVFDRNDLETIVSITEPLGNGRVEDIYRDAWDHVAAPPTAQAEGWISVDERLPEHGQAVAFVVRTDGFQQHLNGRVLGGCFVRGQGFSVPGLGLEATHWMPLPPPPTSAEGVEP